MADLELEERGAIWVIRLNRPGRRNSFTPQMLDDWVSMVGRFAASGDARVLITTATGPAFSAGLDLADRVPIDAPPPLNYKMQKRMHRLGLAMDRLDKPTLASVNGAAIGAGMDVALQSDIRIMARSASMTEGYIRAGLVPGNGGAFYLARLVGIARALELLWTARTLSADECLDWGIASHVVDDDQLEAATMELATTIAAAIPAAAAMIKRAVYQAASTDLATALHDMAAQMAVIQSSAESKELVARLRAQRAAADQAGTGADQTGNADKER
jgi:enoyl-CoA hydratase/carnithine racemase